MPANCSADVTAVVSHFDHVLLTGTKEEQKALKDSFGLFGVTHNDDAGQALVNIFADWQYQRYGWNIFEFMRHAKSFES